MAENNTLDFNGKHYIFKRPDEEIRRKADIEYSSAYNYNLINGLPTMGEQEKALRAKGIINDELIAKEKELSDKIAELYVLLKHEKDEQKRAPLVEAYTNTKHELMQHHQKKQAYFTHTIENKADEARMAYIIHKCVSYDSGELVWKTLIELKEEKDQATVLAVVYYFVSFLNDISVDLLESVPEPEEESTESVSETTEAVTTEDKKEAIKKE